MNYWWVNQGKSQKHQIAGGFIWSPKTKSNGKLHDSYTNLTRTNPGDVVFSFGRKNLRAIGVISGPCEDTVKPVVFGSDGDRWADIGHAIPVTWTEFAKPFAPGDYADRLREHFAPKNKPYSVEQRKGMQGTYLSWIKPELAAAITDVLRERGDGYAVEQVVDLIEHRASAFTESALRNDPDISRTTYQVLVDARRGQGKFRGNALAIERCCRLTGITHGSFLTASHIKPWRDSSNSERLDGNNGLMLAPHVDRLFDKGWISFTDEGEVLAANADAVMALKAWSLIDPSTPPRPFTAKQRVYLAYHREYIFGKRFKLIQ